MRGKRGQAALEFLMTYGWAILVVLVVIGALAYFGVLNPNMLVPEKCTFQTGINCNDHQMSSDGINLKIQNGMGKTLIIKNATATGTVGTKNIYCKLNNTDKEIPNGESGYLEIFENYNGTHNCTEISSSTKERVNLEIIYKYADSTFTHTAKGELFAQVE